jgi:hypothetical protein
MGRRPPANRGLVSLGPATEVQPIIVAPGV